MRREGIKEGREEGAEESVPVPPEAVTAFLFGPGRAVLSIAHTMHPCSCRFGHHLKDFRWQLWGTAVPKAMESQHYWV